MPLTTTQTEREMVKEYLEQRAIAAFTEGDDEQAFILNRFCESVGEMSDEEYEAAYPDPEGDIA